MNHFLEQIISAENYVETRKLKEEGFRIKVYLSVDSYRQLLIEAPFQVHDSDPTGITHKTFRGYELIVGVQKDCVKIELELPVDKIL